MCFWFGFAPLPRKHGTRARAMRCTPILFQQQLAREIPTFGYHATLISYLLSRNRCLPFDLLLYRIVNTFSHIHTYIHLHTCMHTHRYLRVCALKRPCQKHDMNSRSRSSLVPKQPLPAPSGFYKFYSTPCDMGGGNTTA